MCVTQRPASKLANGSNAEGPKASARHKKFVGSCQRKAKSMTKWPGWRKSKSASHTAHLRYARSGEAVLPFMQTQNAACDRQRNAQKVKRTQQQKESRSNFGYNSCSSKNKRKRTTGKYRMRCRTRKWHHTSAWGGSQGRYVSSRGNWRKVTD